MAWGPLDANGKPVSKDRGRDFMRWVKHVKEYDYRYDHRILNAEGLKLIVNSPTCQ